jgi:thiamine biosynthesis protein ThiS
MIRVADQSMAWQSGMTVADVLGVLGKEADVAVVRLNGRLVSRPNFALTLVPDHAQVDLLPVIAGG